MKKTTSLRDQKSTFNLELSVNKLNNFTNKVSRVLFLVIITFLSTTDSYSQTNPNYADKASIRQASGISKSQTKKSFEDFS